MITILEKLKIALDYHANFERPPHEIIFITTQYNTTPIPLIIPTTKLKILLNTNYLITRNDQLLELPNELLSTEMLRAKNKFVTSIVTSEVLLNGK